MVASGPAGGPPRARMSSVESTGSHLQPGDGCVVSYCPIASSFGARVLRSGGNAVDAAVATALALAVTYPQAGNLGGGGFMLIRLRSGDTHFLDYREMAPKATDARMYLESSGRRNENAVLGGAPVCVPGTVAGLSTALARFGTWSWDQVVSVVIDLAERGLWVTTRQAAYFRMYERDLARYPTSAETYFPHGAVPLPGTSWVQPHMAWTLRRLAEHGPDDFYKGEIASRLIETIQANAGVMDHADLAAYEARWRDPISCSFQGRTLYTAPAPSGGGIVIRVSTGILEAADCQRMKVEDRVCLLTRALRVSFELRRRVIGDPDHVSAAQREAGAELLARCLAKAGDIDWLERTLELDRPHHRGDDGRDKNTTHFCVLDNEGNAVSNTYSLNTLFGSKLVPRGCGFLLNNSMDDFSLTPDTPNYYGLVESESNTPTPHRRPTGSMAPTIAVSPSGEAELLLGASGGPRIPTAITQLLISILVDGEMLPVAMRTPRVHQQVIPNEVAIEPMLAPNIRKALERMGRGIAVHLRLGVGIGIQRLPDNGLAAALDFRFSQEA